MPLTTTSYAILGLLDLRDWSAYDLAQQAHRSLAYVWPVSETQLYAEPKRLQREGLITIRHSKAGPQRTRQMLHITAKGRTALRAWLAAEPLAPRLQMEVLLRALFATAGTKQDLLDALDATRRTTQETYDAGYAIVESYAEGDNPFPERTHVNVLWMAFVHDYLRLVLDWVEWATAEVDRWDEFDAGDASARINALLQRMLAGRRVLDEHPANAGPATR